MTKASEFIPKNINVIPQIFYDIIARLIPGSLTILIAVFINYGTTKTFSFIGNLIGKENEIAHVSFSFIGMILIAAYSVSLILMGIWSLFVKLFRISKWNTIFLKTEDKRWNDINVQCQANARLIFKEGENGTNRFPTLSFVYDFVRLHAPDVGSRLVKVRAECHMCSVLLCGFFFLAIWNGIKYFNHISWDTGMMEIFLILSGLGLFFLMKDLEERFMTGMCNYWSILNTKMKLFNKDEISNNKEA